ncbi:KaiC domain-containing protein [Haloarcula sp. CBA1130]|uniref:KaiC domain-containing protein n=1 Tax=unclassified Haloarcula TaxID=2624677 RepID=UPI001246E275|nr:MULTISPECIES: KaiC domain-containing protein [unclassified Haloarcula]KAA9398873.1 KaiC domain-containing protein [Haloarcula sp. CBA1129]KAA9403387.1 KaiC domain-containing protein [Haloarcula sp. CBA1130]
MSGDNESDDDWFESALDDEDGDSQPTDADDTPVPEAESDAEESASADTGPVEADSDDGTRSGDSSPFDDDGSAVSDSDSDSSPFDDGGDDPFSSGGSSTVDADAGSSSDDDGGLFDDDFASAFESAGSGDGDTGSDFEEEFESDIPRVDIGIEGLDQMIQGGIPQRHLIVTIGSAGTGKTTFGLQFLHHGLQNGENAVFLTLEQSHEAILDTADDRDWGFAEYEERGQLAIVDLDPVEMANSLDNIRGELPALIEKFDADRLVLDSVSLLEMMYDDQSRRRTEVFDFTRSLKQAGVTTMLVSEASESNPFASRHGIIEYLTDAVFILQYVRSDTGETRLAVEIQKIRNANHSRETKPYEITNDGISVYQQANIF